MLKKLIALGSAAVMLVVFVSLPAIGADEEDKPKYKIKQVMGKVMKKKTGLKDKVIGGEASDEEKKQLHEMLVALGKNKPPKGDAESWKKLTGALVKASKGVVEGEEDAVAALKKASNCGACHKVHKGK